MDLEDALRQPINQAAWQQFGRQVPALTRKALFHYTSLAGLYGIVTSNVLWATDASFLNDPSETKYARQIIEESLEEVSKRYDHTTASLMDRLVRLNVEIAAGYDIFVASFSEREDLLGQWVGYTPAAAGVSIGFRPSFLRTTDLRLRRVIYSRRRQHEIVSSILARYADTFANDAQAIAQPLVGMLGGVMNLLLHYCSLCFKNHAFAEEREWRMVSFLEHWNAIVRYRAVGNSLTPYVELPLTTGADESLPIHRIVIGPACAERNIKSISHFLQAKGVRAKISTSRVPYRNVR